MLSRQKKEENLARFSSKIKDAAVIVIAENQGLTVANFSDMRHAVKQADGDSSSVQVVKNTLATIAVKDSPFAALADNLSGALVYGVGSDPASMAKHFINTAKKNNKLVIRGAVLANGNFMDQASVKALAELPSRETLLAQLAGTMQMPITQFVRGLSAVPSGLVRALAQYRDQKK